MLDREIRLMMTRRLLLRRGTIGLAAVCFAPWWAGLAPAAEVFEVTHSDADWRKLLTPGQYAVLRQRYRACRSRALLHEDARTSSTLAVTAYVLLDEFDSGPG